LHEQEEGLLLNYNSTIANSSCQQLWGGISLKKKIGLLITLIFTLAFNLMACQAKPSEIELEYLKDEQGLYKYADLKWGSTPDEVEKYFGKALGEPQDFVDGVTIYTIEKLMGYNGITARVSCEFFNDKLYEVGFIFKAKDVGDADLNTVFSSILEILREEYGEADKENLDNYFMHLVFDTYQWKAFTENSFTALSLSKSRQNSVLTDITISIFDVSYSSIYDIYIEDLENI